MAYKRPESVLVIVYTQEAQVLLLHRITPPSDIWQSVTGSLAWGEAAHVAAARELFEETGINSQPIATNQHYNFDIFAESRPLYAPDVTENREQVYELCVEQSVEIRLNASEHDEFQWLPMEAAIETVWSWSNRAALESLWERILD